ncbi:MAG: hypothetical protein RIS43_1104 [Actinomycetota bacterium]|jgi:hypothetical protein
MRTYWPISLADLKLADAGQALDLSSRRAVAATTGFATTLETTDQDELDLMAALAASDLADGKHAVVVTENNATVLDDELGEVQLSGSATLTDIECILIADVESQELSWFGIQELTELAAALAAKGMS